jgi:hypothetical protein
MTASLILSTSIMVMFQLAAFAWSVWRSINSRGKWRILHGLIAALMIGGALSVFANWMGGGVLIGLALVLTSLSALLFDASRARWLAFIQIFSGVLLAAGYAFGSG